MDSKLIELTAGIVASYVERNSVSANDVPNLIKTVHAALSGTTAPEVPAAEETVKLTPAQIRRSITPDYLVSFLDGKHYRTLRRHVTTHGLTFDEYKAKFNLGKDYPSVAPSYSAQRSEMAKAIGLGAKGRGRTPEPVAPPPAPEPVAKAAPAPKKGRAKKETAAA